MISQPLDRRTLVKGVGAAIALPSSKVCYSRHHGCLHRICQGPTPHGVRLCTNGLNMENFTPAEVGRDYKLTPLLTKLAEHERLQRALWPDR